MSGGRITPAREQQADAVRRMDLCSDGTQIRRRRGGAYRERCSGDARSAADLSRVKTSISVGALSILSKMVESLVAELGRASCRVRVWRYVKVGVGEGNFKKKNI